MNLSVPVALLCANDRLFILVVGDDHMNPIDIDVNVVFRLSLSTFKSARQDTVNLPLLKLGIYL